MRKGIILSINMVAGVGVLQDTNNQNIRFYVEDSKKIPARGSHVSFEITFRHRHLVAVNIKKIIVENVPD